VRYIGNVSFKEGIWVGVELDSPSGENDGTVDKRWYFKCKEKHGIFVEPNSIEIIDEKKESSVKCHCQEKSQWIN